MSLTANTLAQTLRLAAEEAQTLRTFIDDLDGWDGKDLDTGTNASRTLSALADSLGAASDHLPFATGLEVAAEAGIVGGVGHCGQMLTLLLYSWHDALDGSDKLTPVVLRQMLKSSLRPQSGHMRLSDSLNMLLEECSAELDSFGQTLPDAPELINIYASHCQYALVEATNQSTGRIDPGAAVYALLITCLDAIVRDDVSLLESFAQMLADLAASHQPKGPQAHAPQKNRAFTVDMIVSGSQADIEALTARFDLLGAAHSLVGSEDFFGVGEWRLHVDTAVPLAVYPQDHPVRSFTVSDARPHEMLGVDGLADGFVHRGVHILERPSMKRVERAHVIVLTNAPGMVESFAQCGATVMLHPKTADARFMLTVAQGSTTGVTLLVPTDEATHDLAQNVAAKAAPGTRLLVASTFDELSAQSIANATATTFVPQPGGYQAADALVDVLTQAMAHAQSTFRTIVLPSTDVQTLSEAVDALLLFGARSWRLLLSRNADPQTTAIIQHLLPTPFIPGLSDLVDLASTHSFDSIEAQYAGPTLLQGIQ